MNTLDDFEKYLRDQLKGHAEPEPLMWNRLNDAIGRMQPWYARSAFKYALTAVGAMIIGAVSSYLYLEQSPVSPTNAIAKNATKKTLITSKVEHALPVAEFALKNPLETVQLTKPTLPTYANSTQAAPIALASAALVPIVLEENPRTNAVQLDKLPLLASGQIKLPKPILQNHPKHLPLAGRFELSIATGQSWSNLPNFQYQLGPQGMQQGTLQQQQSPLLMLQARVYKNWHLQTGVQLIHSTLEERFSQTDVFSFDEKEHYLFPYLYGFRQVSDEELHEGPWPFGPNPPGGPEISHVKANFTSIVNQRKLVFPFTLSYHRQLGPFEAQLHAGLAFSFTTKMSQSLLIAGYAPSSVYLPAANERLQTYAQSQVRLSYNASQHLSVFLEPQLRSSLLQQNLLHASPYRSNSKAIIAGLSWKF